MHNIHTLGVYLYALHKLPCLHLTTSVIPRIIDPTQNQNELSSYDLPKRYTNTPFPLSETQFFEANHFLDDAIFYSHKIHDNLTTRRHLYAGASRGVLPFTHVY